MLENIQHILTSESNQIAPGHYNDKEVKYGDNDYVATKLVFIGFHFRAFFRSHFSFKYEFTRLALGINH